MREGKRAAMPSVVAENGGTPYDDEKPRLFAGPTRNKERNASDSVSLGLCTSQAKRMLIPLEQVAPRPSDLVAHPGTSSRCSPGPSLLPTDHPKRPRTKVTHPTSRKTKYPIAKGYHIPRHPQPRASPSGPTPSLKGEQSYMRLLATSRLRAYVGIGSTASVIP